MHRIAVRYKSMPLMPMKSSRAKRFIDSGRGVVRYDRKLKVHYLKLKSAPSGTDFQVIALGIDPGSCFDGFSVVSADCHHENFELIHRTKKGKNSITKYLERRASNRRLRRSRLRHRKFRFDNRTAKKLAPTIRSMVDFRKWLVDRISRIYPISLVVVEDVAFNHSTTDKKKKKSERSFSHAEQGKTEFYRYLRSIYSLRLVKGYDTSVLRREIFGHDIKCSDKSSREFRAHCVDSFVISFNAIDSTKTVKTNERVTFIEKIVRVRRCLTRERPLHYNNHKSNNSYYRLLRGGVRVNYVNISSHRNICRVKAEGDHSNHPKQWIYIDNGFSAKKKSTTQPYGGTKMNKIFKNNEFINRRIS